jgi:hypothetical protein
MRPTKLKTLALAALLTGVGATAWAQQGTTTDPDTTRDPSTTTPGATTPGTTRRAAPTRPAPPAPRTAPAIVP